MNVPGYDTTTAEGFREVHVAEGIVALGAIGARANPGKNRARANLIGQNGRVNRIKPVVRALKCAKQKRRKAKRNSHRRARVASASTAG